MTKIKNNYKPTTFFWSDIDQARDRLAGCVVVYEGKPVYIQEINGGYADGVPRAFIQSPKQYVEGGNNRRMLSAKGFERFRESAYTGFVNIATKTGNTAFLLSRRTARRMSHGLTANNVYIGRIDGGPTNLRFLDVFSKDGYSQASDMIFPGLDDVLLNISPKESIAYNPHYAVYKDDDNIIWLYRKSEKIGMFTGSDTLVLLAKGKFYREEIQEDPTFTCNTIKEF